MVSCLTSWENHSEQCLSFPHIPAMWAANRRLSSIVICHRGPPSYLFPWQLISSSGVGNMLCMLCLIRKSLSTCIPGDSDGKESACSAGDLILIPGSERSPGERNGYPLQYSCLENLCGQWSLVGYSPWGHKELDMTERLTLSLFLSLLNTTSWPWADCERRLWAPHREKLGRREAQVCL